MLRKILFMHQTSAIGGGSYCLLNIIKKIDRDLFEPIVVLLGEGPLSEELRKLDVRVEFFPQMSSIPYNHSFFRIKSLHTYFRVYRSLKPFKALLREINADVLYLNNMMIYPYLRCAKEQKMKTVIHVREHWSPKEHSLQLEWARRYIYSYADKVIAINKFSANIFPLRKVEIVYDWIDMQSRYKPISMKDLFEPNVENLKILLYVGGMQKIKGAYEVVKTFIEQIPNNNYRLLVIGFTKAWSDKGMVHEIKKILYKIGIPTYEYKVKMLVRKDSRIVCIPSSYEITDLIKQANCMVSFFTIPHANLSMAESIILGTPVIAARTEESEEYSLDGRLALLYKMNDITSFGKTLSSFLDNENELRSALSIENRELIKNMFSPKTNSAKLNNILKDLIS